MRVVAAVLLLVSALHAGLWGVLRDKEPAPDFKGLLPSVSYAPFEGSAHPDIDNIPSVEKIRADLKTLSTMTRAIRLYSSTGGVELVPPIAAEFGLKVTVGAWIDKDKDRNEREIKAAIELARKNSNVNGVVVGNEVIYRGEQKVEDLIEMIKKVKGSVRVPVTTGEIWNIWRDNPDLGSNVDFIAAHVLPYWENFRSDQAVDQAVDRYNLFAQPVPRQAHRDRRVRLAERGLQFAQRRPRSVPAGTDLAQLRQPRRRHRHGIQHRRGHRSALEILRRRRRSVLGHPQRQPRAEVRLDRAGGESRLLEADGRRPPGRNPAVAADPAAAAADGEAGVPAVGHRQWRRRLGRHRVRVLERTLFHLRLRLRAHARHDPACSPSC
ncbi:hypothetical protein ACVWZW_001633 [Bradyrhizobium sp. F1.13.4]